ncbi:MAG: hypothetical protein WCZ90_17705 [Melioribacteraceae bacterium]
MKTIIFLVASLLLYVNSYTYSQSDYEELQNFKKQCSSIEESIKNAATPEECIAIRESITNLRNDYIGYKKIFDKALYPENYESTFEKIERALEYKNADLRQITTLTTRVGELETQVDQLNLQNETLLKQVEQLKIQVENGEATIADLKRAVARLSGSIKERDLLVRDLVDSLLVEFGKSSGNTQRDKKAIITKINKGNLFYNIKRTIEDNIQFTRVTQMTSDDFNQMKNQHQDLSKMWQLIGPKLSNVYLNKKDKKLEIAQIDSLLAKWNEQMNTEIWHNIFNQFVAKGVKLVPFNNAEQFVSNINGYIDDKINSIDNASEDDALNYYKVFADTVYHSTIEKDWIPILLESNQLSQNEKDQIDVKIEEWKNVVTSSPAYWGYILVALIIIAAAVVLIRSNKKSSSAIKIK